MMSQPNRPEYNLTLPKASGDVPWPRHREWRAVQTWLDMLSLVKLSKVALYGAVLTCTSEDGMTALPLVEFDLRAPAGGLPEGMQGGSESPVNQLYSASTGAGSSSKRDWDVYRMPEHEDDRSYDVLYDLSVARVGPPAQGSTPLVARLLCGDHIGVDQRIVGGGRAIPQVLVAVCSDSASRPFVLVRLVVAPSSEPPFRGPASSVWSALAGSAKAAIRVEIVDSLLGRRPDVILEDRLHDDPRDVDDVRAAFNGLRTGLWP
jgi:hypothetical protein